MFGNRQKAAPAAAAISHQAGKPPAADHARSIYRDHLLSCRPMPLDDGQYQARVAITYLGGEKTRSQHFLDLDSFPSETAANERALQAAQAWVDANWHKL
ncbi:hypothetical protein BH11PSE9_BH11PSE9_12130 [soil metagenome]